MLLSAVHVCLIKASVHGLQCNRFIGYKQISTANCRNSLPAYHFAPASSLTIARMDCLVAKIIAKKQLALDHKQSFALKKLREENGRTEKKALNQPGNYRGQTTWHKAVVWIILAGKQMVTTYLINYTTSSVPLRHITSSLPSIIPDRPTWSQIS